MLPYKSWVKLLFSQKIYTFSSKRLQNWDFWKSKKSTVIIAYMYLEPEYGNSKRIPNWLFLLPPLLENINKVLCVKYLTRLTAGHLPWSWQIHSSWVLSTALGMWLMPQHRHLWSQILKKRKRWFASVLIKKFVKKLFLF